MFRPTTKLEVAKLAAHLAVAYVTGQKVQTLVANHTDVDPNGIPVVVGSAVVGHIVATKTDPYTDDACERAFDWYADRKVKKAAIKKAKKSL